MFAQNAFNQTATVQSGRNTLQDYLLNADLDKNIQSKDQVHYTLWLSLQIPMATFLELFTYHW